MPPTADSVQMAATQDIVQIPATQDTVQSPPTQDILQMAAQIVDIQPLNRALGGKRYLEIKEWNGSKRVDLRFWKYRIFHTKEGVSLHFDQSKALCNMSEVIDDLLTRVIEKEPVDWRYHIGDDAFVTIKAPFPFVHIRKHFISTGEWTYRPTKIGVALHFGKWKELKKNNPIVGRKRARTETVSSLV